MTEVTELRCTSCFAPIGLSGESVSRCRYCGATMVIEGGHAAAAAPGQGRLFLEKAGPNVISVIKVVREHTGLGLKQANQLVQSAPCEVAEWDDPDRMAAFRAALIGAGAKIR